MELDFLVRQLAVSGIELTLQQAVGHAQGVELDFLVRHLAVSGIELTLQQAVGRVICGLGIADGCESSHKGAEGSRDQLFHFSLLLKR